MAGKKPISVNLRDLQRVLNEGKPEMPRFSSGVTGNEEETQSTSFGTERYKSGTSRWANEGDDDDDDFDNRGARDGYDEKPEPDFSTVRSTDNQFVRSDSRGQSGGRNGPADDAERKPDEDVWRNTTMQPITEETEVDDDVWRRPVTNTNSERSPRRGPETPRREDRSTRDVDDNDMFNRATLQRENTGKKLYVPPSKKNERNAFNMGDGASQMSSRFSCLENDSEPRYQNSTTFESSRTKEIFAMHRRDSESREFGNQYGRDAFRDNRENSRSNFFGDSQKSGVFVPSYKRTQTQQQTTTPKNSTVKDIFLKAAAIADNKNEDKKKVEKTEQKKDTLTKQPSQAEIQVQQKKDAIVRHNRMYHVNHDVIKQVEDAVNTLINGGQLDVLQVVPEDEEELVPAVVTCLIVSKHCETCETMEDVKNKFKTVAPLLINLCERHEDDIEAVLLTEVAKFMCEWKLPAISESIYLIEAVFDALVQCEVISRDTAIQWLENLPEDVPDRINVILQLLSWKKWLLGESLEAAAEGSEQESEEEEEDIDIEALVPKPVRISKPMLY
ncbi:Uncharacterized protein BXIN_1501 [Babesia sp. Xinjiang]|uniref:Uncharacterized protein n=1 Tax=Babesia sp. Xinjiang TaxID=462227 RepID=UPI000A22FA54|nr:Uncharacterized protein BXIN_1501 [Babesia sp. Xinjiang]ORM42234.1 Uncharacterized protein BXIN_1501 [Babesia sp. Xinjiang]